MLKGRDWIQLGFGFTDAWLDWLRDIEELDTLQKEGGSERREISVK